MSLLKPPSPSHCSTHTMWSYTDHWMVKLVLVCVIHLPINKLSLQRAKPFFDWGIRFSWWKSSKLRSNMLLLAKYAHRLCCYFKQASKTDQIPVAVVEFLPPLILIIIVVSIVTIIIIIYFFIVYVLKISIFNIKIYFLDALQFYEGYSASLVYRNQKKQS